MANGNGFWRSTLVGLLLTLILASFGWATVVLWTANNAIAKEAEARQTDDKEIRKEVNDNIKEQDKKLDKIITDQSDLKAMIARLETKIERIP